MQKLFRLLQTDNSGINLFSLLTYVHIKTAIFYFYRSFELKFWIKRFYFYFFFKLPFKLPKTYKIFTREKWRNVIIIVTQLFSKYIFPIKIIFYTYIWAFVSKWVLQYRDNSLWLRSHVQYCIASSKYAVYKLVGIVRSNLLHNHSAPPNT